MNLKVILRNVGFALLVNALFMLLSILVSVMNGNDSALAALMISFVMTFTVGIFPFIFVHKTSAISLKDGYMIIVLSWLLSFLFGMMPYLLWGGPFSVVNAWFESVSGFTTTGATILKDVEALPKSLLFWRSSTHFIGGLGVVVFLMLMIPSTSPMRLKLVNMELSSLSKEGYQSRANKTVLIFTYVYLALFALAFVLYLICGMSPFDAINHAFSVCATGGYSTKNASIGYWDSNLINIVSTVLMVLASIHFAVLFFCVVNRSLKPLRNPVLKFYLMCILVSTIVVALIMKAGNLVDGWGKALINSSFHVASYVSTTGFDVADRAYSSTFIYLIMIYLSLQCGMAGSTTGGLKVNRVLLIFKSISNYVKRILHPSAIDDIKVGQRIVRNKDVYPHLMFFVIYAIALFFSVGFCHLFGNESVALSASIASLSNVGLMPQEIGMGGNYDWMSGATKIVLSVDMLLGRLEIYPVLAVMSMIFSKKS